MRPAWVLTAVLMISACVQPTKFEGEPKFPDGVTGCRRECAQQGLEMAAFVYSGEFATSCVCQPIGQVGAAGAGESAPAVGVVVQAAAAAAAANAQSMQRAQQSSATR